MHLPRICPICGQEYIPQNASRAICYEQSCIDTRSQEYNRTKMDKRRVLKREGKWKEHVVGVKGTGKGRKGRPNTNTRKCLGWCGNDFPVPPGTDVHFCLDCERKRTALLEDFDESALGIGTNELGDVVHVDRGWSRRCLIQPE